jgi:hypothetical protein
MWAGPGNGAPCSACGAAIGTDQTEYEVEFSAANGQAAIAKYRFHPGCYAAWDRARDARRDAGAQRGESA